MSERSFTSVGTSVASRSRRDVARTASGEPSNLRVALVADVRIGDIKVAAPGTVFAASSDGPIRATKTATGAARDFIDRERDKPVSCMALVNNGAFLWVGGAAGDLTVFSARSPVDGGFAPRGAINEASSRTTRACTSSSTSATGTSSRAARISRRASGRATKNACASHHHSGAVKCAIDPAPDPFDATLPPAVWTGASDGKVFAWDDVEGTGAMKESEGAGSSERLEAAAGVSAMCAHPDAHEAWVGYDDGRLASSRARTTASSRTTRARCTASGHRARAHGRPRVERRRGPSCAWDAKTKSCAYILPDQGGFIRGGVVAGWGAWFLTPKKSGCGRPDGGERYARKKRKEAENALEEARSDAAKLRGELEESEARSKMAAETSAGESARTRADLEKANDALADTQRARARRGGAQGGDAGARKTIARERARGREARGGARVPRQDLETREKSSSELSRRRRWPRGTGDYAIKVVHADAPAPRHRARQQEKLRAVEAAELAAVGAPRRILETLETHRNMSFAGEFDALRAKLRECAR